MKQVWIKHSARETDPPITGRDRTGVAVILLQDVSKRYADRQDVISHLDLSLEAGDMAFLTGHSGAGKSTLLKLIAAIERPTRGQIVVDGSNITHIRRNRIPYLRRKIGIIFQNHHLLHDRSVFENVALPLRIAGYHSREISRRTRAALGKVGLSSKENANPITLSGGEQQRVGIARAVVNRPPILLADEPTGNLDPELSEQIMRLFIQFNQVGLTVLVASHDVDLLSRLNIPILRLQNGRLVENSINTVCPTAKIGHGTQNQSRLHGSNQMV